MSVYVAPEVAAVRALHPYLADPEFRALSMRDQIALQAETVYRAFHTGDDRVAPHLLSWWPEARGRAWAELRDGPFTPADARLTLAREYGFADEVPDAPTDPGFEAALDQMLAGDLGFDTGFATQRSSFGHGATLLHYLGANGVETHRQVTPLNAPEIARHLIAHGADPRAEAHMYGGGQTPVLLAATSAHPHAAGIAEALIQALDQPSGLP